MLLRMDWRRCSMTQNFCLPLGSSSSAIHCFSSGGNIWMRAWRSTWTNRTYEECERIGCIPIDRRASFEIHKSWLEEKYMRLHIHERSWPTAVLQEMRLYPQVMQQFNFARNPTTCTYVLIWLSRLSLDAQVQLQKFRSVLLVCEGGVTVTVCLKCPPCFPRLRPRILPQHSNTHFYLTSVLSSRTSSILLSIRKYGFQPRPG